MRTEPLHELLALPGRYQVVVGQVEAYYLSRHLPDRSRGWNRRGTSAGRRPSGFSDGTHNSLPMQADLDKTLMTAKNRQTELDCTCAWFCIAHAQYVHLPAAGAMSLYIQTTWFMNLCAFPKH